MYVTIECLKIVRFINGEFAANHGGLSTLYMHNTSRARNGILTCQICVHYVQGTQGTWSASRAQIVASALKNKSEPEDTDFADGGMVWRYVIVQFLVWIGADRKGGGGYDCRELR